jgi:hypothetical protein
LKVVLAYLNPILYPKKPERVTMRIASTIVSCLFLGRKTNWARIFLEVMNKQIARTQKTPTSILCYLVHFYKHQKLPTSDEIVDYESHMEAVEGGDPDQKEADHSDEDSKKDKVQEVVGRVTWKKNKEPAKAKVLDYLADLDDDVNVAVSLDAIARWSPSKQFTHIKRWAETGVKKSKPLEGVI